MDLMKYILEKPVVSDRIARWKMLLTEYDIQYVTQKAIKGSVLSDYLSHLPVKGYQPLRFDFPNEDIMFIIDFTMPGSEISPEEGPEPGSRLTLVFDDASNAPGHGIGYVITSPTSFHLPFIARLYFDYTNNMEEYKACIYGLEAAIDLRIKILEVYSDSALVISQVRVKWKNEAPVIHIDHLDEPTHYLVIEADPDDKPWFYNIRTFFEKQQYPKGHKYVISWLVIRLASPMPYESYKDVPYKYNVTMLEDGKKVHIPSFSFVVNIVDVRGVTRSGRVFSVAAPKRTEDVVVGKPTQEKTPIMQSGQSSSMDQSSDQDEVLKLIKKSDFNVVD
ncbi:uncharacterized protein LOC127099641 [Lathyrus oleraceus]|uniref:uncharacterized protein LOC127099641 n=1 Tax=Pisum sativum TaxID=3888 RepID=UPI0021D2E578|nr:uncharacterized protein LOC127099641 [Pisum sativum]